MWMLILITRTCAKRSGLVQVVYREVKKNKKHARLQASSSATTMILLQCPQQKFESYHRREIDIHNLSLRSELLCFTHN